MIPDNIELSQELIELRVYSVHTYNPGSAHLLSAFGLTLNDGRRARIVTKLKTNSEYLMPDTPLKEIVVTYNKHELWINHLTFVFVNGTNKRLGQSKDDGRKEHYVFSKI